MSNLSLSKSIRTCKVNVDDAPRVQSARFQNSSMLTCPMWNQMDSAGRRVCADSFRATTHGCHLPADRIAVENGHRPAYMNYVTLDAQYLEGNACEHASTSNPSWDALSACQTIQNTRNITGAVGIDTRATIEGRCKPDDGSFKAALADTILGANNDPGMAAASSDNRICW